MADQQLEELFTDSEDELPTGWEMRVTDAGRVFYVDHSSKQTQWQHPKTGTEKYLSTVLPFGWEKATDEEGQTLFLDRVNKKNTYVDPRIAYAMSDKKKAMLKFDADSSAMTVMRGQDMRGKTALITGANSGIGYETALALSLHGCHVVLACRDLKKAKKAADVIRVKQSLPVPVDVLECDLASLDSVKKCAECFLQLKCPLDILVCNAGVMGLAYSQTVDGIETTFATNHLGHFYLTDLLKDVLIESAPSRVVVVSSESHRYPSLYDNAFDVPNLPMKKSEYWSIVAYNQSKLCNLLFTFELNRRLSPYGVFCNAVHPGNLVYTQLARHSYFCKVLFTLCRPFSKSQAQGAATTVYCAASPQLENVGGYYFNNCCGCHPSSLANDEELAKRLWDFSEKLAYRKVDSEGKILGVR
ncbi:WW domain-containing oxidoreductase-like [Hydractinia symbiolongicarpus]|uniref:WW domain-containing oxidoreductase-like n=1 Tax=Hydractinia symbiolongicarpus TaxID=13093 RepID=UPI002550271A|nr:WW domain-containing oxidoreductase-like [Hydractinia symbiolongicarpus]